MTKRLLLSCLALTAVLSSGCLSFKKSSKSKDTLSSHEVENTFRQRWIDKRVGELTAQGQADAAARKQAADEFQARYGDIGGAQK